MLVFSRHTTGGNLINETIANVLGLQVIVWADDVRYPEEIEVRFWFEPSKICTVYWFKPGDSFTVNL